ncbi:MAG TPA: hypothetical protein DCZ80_05945 [Legionellales bacterium]|nr:hypothetical protein [Legionellales bacterium]
MYLLGLLNGQIPIRVFLELHPILKKYGQSIASEQSIIPRIFNFFFSAPVHDESLGYLINPEMIKEYLAVIDHKISLIEDMSSLRQWIQHSVKGQRKLAIVQSALSAYSTIELIRHERAFTVRVYHCKSLERDVFLEDLRHLFEYPTHIYFNHTSRSPLFDKPLSPQVFSSLSFSYALEDYLFLNNQVYWNICSINYEDYQIHHLEIPKKMNHSLDNLLRNQLKNFIFYQCLGLSGDSNLHYRQMIRLHHLYEMHLSGDRGASIMHFFKEYQSPILQEVSDHIFSLILIESGAIFIHEPKAIQKCFYQLILHCIRNHPEHPGYQFAVSGLGVGVTERYDEKQVKKIVLEKLMQAHPSRRAGLGFH